MSNAAYDDPIEGGNTAFQDGDDEPEVVFLGPDDPDPEPEVEVSEDDELPPDLKGLSKKDLAAKLTEMTGKADQTAALKQVMEEMQNRGQSVPQAMPQQQPGESDEAFYDRFNKELFKSKNPAALFRELVERTTAPYVGQISQTMGSVSRKQLRNDPVDGEIFKRYEKEVDQMLAGLSAGDRMNPQALEWAFNRVKQNHVDDIAEERASKRIEEEVAKRVAEELEKAGVKSGGQAKPRFSESGSAVPRRRVTQRYTEEDVRRAKANQMELETYLKYKKARGA